MHSRRLLTLPLCLAALGAVPTVADAAKSTSRYPTVSKIAPMRVGIGETMTITGKNFRPGPRRTTIGFKRDGKPMVFIKADNATRTRLVVQVPEKLRSFLGKRQGALVATRFRIRISAYRFAKSYTSLRRSPTILPTGATPGATTSDGALAGTNGTTLQAATGPAAAVATGPGATGDAPVVEDCDGDGTVDVTDTDDDNDLLTDVLELTLRTNRCAKDTDGDGMEDGWEYKSALDLNRESCPQASGDVYPVPCAPATPYPGKRPYPNPLDGSDAEMDYDGDKLPAWAEHRASLRHGRSVTNLWYSDGLQASQDSNPGDGCRGITPPAPLGGNPQYTLDRGGMVGRGYKNGCLTDDERDEDNDFLTNEEELGGELSRPEWWQVVWKEPLYPLNLAGTDWLDTDSDGDTVPDGIDDQDNDDFWNVEEINRGPMSVDKEDIDSADRSGLWVNPFNPCLPSPLARTCMVNLPTEGEIVRPFHRWDAKPDEYPKPRWPLYGTYLYEGGKTGAYGPEITGYVRAAGGGAGPIPTQPMPPTHPMSPGPAA